MNASQIRFRTAPRDQGQMVERAWAQAQDGFVERVADGSTRTVEYFFHRLTARAARTEWEFYAANGSPVEQDLACRRSSRMTETEALASLRS